MIQTQTVLKVADNSGAKNVMCIKILGSNKKYASVCDVIIGVVTNANPNLKAKRSEIVRAVVVRTKHFLRRKNGSRVRFDDNAAVILQKGKNPLGTRVFGPVPRELKTGGFSKIVSLATEVL